MHTTTQDPSTHLRGVQELLFELDKMKNSGIGAIERLEYILDKSAPLVEGFDLADAFDVELRARNRRLEDLSDMDRSLNHSKKQWEVGPLQEDVREAAGRLFKHLDSFLKSAIHSERKSEIEMLSALWDYEPDLSHLYPGLTSWRPAPLAKEPLPELQEFYKKKAALYEEIEANREPPQEWLAKEFEGFDDLDAVRRALRIAVAVCHTLTLILEHHERRIDDSQTVFIDAFTEPSGPVEYNADFGAIDLQMVDADLGVVHPVTNLPEHHVPITVFGEDHTRLLLALLLGLPNLVEADGLVLFATLGHRLNLHGRNTTVIVEEPNHFPSLVFVFAEQDLIAHGKISVSHQPTSGYALRHRGHRLTPK